MKKARKEEYQNAFRQVRLVVNSIDPMGLIDWCGPEEYDAEVSDILTKLSQCGTEEEIKSMVIQVFRKWFDDPGDLSYYSRVGHDLMIVKNTYSWLKPQ
ncbi:DUF1871 family protein [Pontibacter mangrovi]|uniref:DUF1871 family protein n=1 Tax=Pontibacter mangrovi TaxID=2589816 RepID=A0A501W209_9BACT|nr:DUF1871 family protein [Pontibacter mangrovi]TPE42782.1 DUF1871 family protein [Pontibacter mangrovi]